MERLSEYSNAVKGLDAKEIISWAIQTFGTRKIILASSFSAEDQVITDLAIKTEKNARIFTLDTGRHFQETYDVWHQSVNFWGINYEIGFPETSDICELLEQNDPNLFYGNVESRKACCTVRKTKPLKKLLSTVNAWIVGLRSEQSITRIGLNPFEWDEPNGIYRISPLYNWSEQEVFEYVNKNKLPTSDLYSKGFRSIGCAPCTRAIGPDEDIRAGRWWWEEPEHKECGLHDRRRGLER